MSVHISEQKKKQMARKLLRVTPLASATDLLKEMEVRLGDKKLRIKRLG